MTQGKKARGNEEELFVAYYSSSSYCPLLLEVAFDYYHYHYYYCHYHYYYH